MSTIKYKVNLSDDEKIQLEALLSKGKCAARKKTGSGLALTQIMYQCIKVEQPVTR